MFFKMVSFLNLSFESFFSDSDYLTSSLIISSVDRSLSLFHMIRNFSEISHVLCLDTMIFASDSFQECSTKHNGNDWLEAILRDSEHPNKPLRKTENLLLRRYLAKVIRSPFFSLSYPDLYLKVLDEVSKNPYFSTLTDQKKIIRFVQLLRCVDHLENPWLLLDIYGKLSMKCIVLVSRLSNGMGFIFNGYLGCFSSDVIVLPIVNGRYFNRLFPVSTHCCSRC